MKGLETLGYFAATHHSTMQHLDGSETSGYLYFLGLAVMLPILLLFMMPRSTEHRFSIACFIGWIPGNLIACGYIGSRTGSLYNFLVLFIFTTICQFGWLCVASAWFDKQREM